MANSIKLNETKKLHFIYKTTNLVNGKYYIGMHSTNNIKDGYLGSGTRLRRSIRKYGKENFKCEILEYCSDYSSLKEREKELVTEESIKDELCMNLKPGGLGGFVSDEVQRKACKLGGEAYLHRLKTDITFYTTHCERQRNRFKRLWSEGKMHTPDWNGKTHNADTIKKMKGHKRQTGELNSQFGKLKSTDVKDKIRNTLKTKFVDHKHHTFNTKWINNGSINKMSDNTEMLPDGWVYGRIRKSK